MNITQRGLVLAAKNLGSYLLTWALTDIRKDPIEFAYQLVVYALINVPTDLLLLNHWSKTDATKEEA